MKSTCHFSFAVGFAFAALLASCRPPQSGDQDDAAVQSLPSGQASNLSSHGRYPFGKTAPTCDGAGGGIGGFGAGRDNGARLHAGCDLYGTVGDPIYSIADGIVLSSEYDFYCNTNALEVLHGRVENGKVVERFAVIRYGEIKPGSARGLKSGSVINKGEQIAAVGKLSCYYQPMLHFEMYSGAASGTLSGGGAYRRRSDLVNPTKILMGWRGGPLQGGCNRAKLEECKASGGGDACYAKWECTNNNSVTEMGGVVSSGQTQSSEASPPATQPSTASSCNRTQFDICRKYGGGEACYAKWGCPAP